MSQCIKHDLFWGDLPVGECPVCAIEDRDELKKELKKASELLREIWSLHRDSGVPEYNHCDNGEDCEWCVEAKEIIEKEAGR